MTAALRATVAEFIGTLVLLAGIVGSGIMGERLAQGNAALALLANAAATAALLYVLVSRFAALSGAHFNPVVSLVAWLRGELASRLLAAYVAAQCAGAVAGVGLAHAMFGLPLLQAGTQARGGGGAWLSETVASAGLLLVILLARRGREDATPSLVAAYIFAAYWFTASTAFANPAVTLARAFTGTFAGIQGADVAGFIVAQIAGALGAWALHAWLVPAATRTADPV